MECRHARFGAPVCVSRQNFYGLHRFAQRPWILFAMDHIDPVIQVFGLVQPVSTFWRDRLDANGGLRFSADRDHFFAQLEGRFATLDLDTISSFAK